MRGKFHEFFYAMAALEDETKKKGGNPFHLRVVDYLNPIGNLYEFLDAYGDEDIEVEWFGVQVLNDDGGGYFPCVAKWKVLEWTFEWEISACFFDIRKAWYEWTGRND